jgi:hypothetical protein
MIVEIPLRGMEIHCYFKLRRHVVLQKYDFFCRRLLTQSKHSIPEGKLNFEILK